LTIILYFYELRLEVKIPLKNRKKIYLCVTVLIFIIFSILFVKLNFNDTKTIIGRIFFKDKYFIELNTVTQDGKKYNKKILMNVDEPLNYSAVEDIFIIRGWAIDNCDIEGSKIDNILIYLDNIPQKGGKFICNGKYGIERRDVAKIYGKEHINSGFKCIIDSNNIKNGVHIFYIYLHTEYFCMEQHELILFVNN